MRTGELLETGSKSFSPCFSKENLKMVKNLSLVLKSQFDCLNHFTFKYLIEDEDFYDYFELDSKFELKEFRNNQCKAKAMTFAKELSDYALINSEDNTIKSIINLLIEEMGMIDEMEEEFKKNYNEEIEKQKKLQEELKRKENEKKLHKIKKENEELLRKINEIENNDNAPARIKPIEASISINIYPLEIGFWSLLAYALSIIILV